MSGVSRGLKKRADRKTWVAWGDCPGLKRRMVLSHAPVSKSRAEYDARTYRESVLSGRISPEFWSSESGIMPMTQAQFDAITRETERELREKNRTCAACGGKSVGEVHEVDESGCVSRYGVCRYCIEVAIDEGLDAAKRKNDKWGYR